MVAGRNLRLRLQVLELLVELGAHIVHAQQVLARILQAQLRVVAARTVLRNASGFLEENSQVLGLRLDHPRDHALLDDGVGAAAEPGAEEDIGHIPPPDVDVIDVIGSGFVVAGEHAFHRDLGIARPLAPRAAQAVVENQLDARAVDRLALARAVEQNVLHGVPAQVLRGGFAQHPAHGVNDVRLAAAVGADNAYQVSGDGYVGGIYERLEACEIDLFESQWSVLVSRL